MFQKDYILRMIEMIGELVAGILGLLKKGKVQEASEELDRVYQEILKEDAAFFQSVPADQLTETLVKEHDYTHGHLEVLSELLYTEGEVQSAKGETNAAKAAYTKALRLYGFLEQQDKTFSFERQAKMAGLQEKIDKLEV